MKTNLKIIVLLTLFAAFFTGCFREDKEVLYISQSSFEVEAVQSNPATMSVTTNLMWSVENSATWLNVSPQKGYGDRELEIFVSPNTSLNSRVASFFIIGEKIRQEVKVTQKGEAPVISLKENGKSVPASETEIDVTVSTNIEYNIVIDQLWVTEITTKTVSEGKHSFLVGKNEELTPRSAKITFSQKNGNVSQVFTVTQAGEDMDIKLLKDTLYFDVKGGYGNVSVSANIPWTATSSHSWVKVVDNIDTKAMKDSTCYFLVEESKSGDVRTAIVVFSRKESSTLELSQTLTVIQDPAPPSISFYPAESVSVPAAGTTNKYVLTVDANFGWTIDLKDNPPASWVNEISWDETSCSFKVDANYDLTPRSTKIVFKQVSGSYSRTYELTQTSSAPSITILPPLDEKPISKDGGEFVLYVESNVSWNFTVDQPWLKVERMTLTKGLEVDALICTVEKSNNSSERTAEISVISGALKQTYTVKQEAGPTQLSASVKKIEVSGEEANVDVTVFSNVEWEYFIPTEYLSWISIATPATKAPFVETGIKVTVIKSTSLKPREGYFVLRQTGSGLNLLKDTVRIYQEGLVPDVHFTPSVESVSGRGGELMLLTDANFPITYDGSNRDWVVLKDYTSQTRYTFTITPTNQTAPRSAVLSFKNTNGEMEVTKTYTLVQRGATVSIADSTVLRTLYVGLNGDLMWDSKWSRERSVAEWYGVKLSSVIDGERRVEELSLPRQGLSGNLENAFFLENGVWKTRIPLEELTYLRVIDLSNNLGLRGELPVNLYKLDALRELNLSNCDFVNTSSGQNIPKEWGEYAGTLSFPYLYSLIVNGNRLSGTIPVEIKNHPNYFDFWKPNQNILPQRGGSPLSEP